MSPIEVMAKAIAKEDWGHGRAGGPWSDELWERQLRGYRELEASNEPFFIKESHYLHGIFRKARAALLALAEVEIPADALNQGAIISQSLEGSHRHKASRIFRAMARAIAQDHPSTSTRDTEGADG
jgi:hypothetical protein